MDQKILDALKTINDKLGGTNDPNENWGSLLQEIAQNVGSGGGGGGDDIFFVDIWWELDGYECSKTFEEIVSAFNDGKTVLFILNHATPQSMIAFEMDSYSVTDVKVWFFGASRETEDKFNFYTITMDSEGISDTYKSYTLSPDDA